MDTEHVLVGFDGSPAAERALRWAMTEASLRDAALRICHAWDWPYTRYPEDRDAMRAVRARGSLTLDEGVRLAREIAPSQDVRPILWNATPSAALLAAGADAALIVVGARGAGGFHKLPLGSAAVNVPAYADRPVVVVPSSESADTAKKIVVGVDGSPASEAALRFALREARLRDATVTLVCAWWDPAALPEPDQLPFTGLEALKEQAKARFTSAVGPCLVDYPDVVVQDVLVRDRPWRVLVDNARDAMLLVVGDRGIGSSPSTLLGTVTRAALHEVPCPVAVAHERDPR